MTTTENRNRKNCARAWRVCALLLGIHWGSLAQAGFDTAMEAFNRGAFDRAALDWREIAADPKAVASTRVRANLGVAAACQKMGLYQEGARALNDAKALLPQVDAALTARYYQQLGNLYVSMHSHEQALQALVDAVAQAERASDPALQAAIFNDYGNALNASGLSGDALTAHSRAAELAREHRLDRLALAAAINIARLQAQRDDAVAARAALTDAGSQLDRVAHDYEWAMASFAFTDLQRDLAAPTDAGAAPQRIARLRQVQAYATEAAQVRVLSTALGREAQDAALSGDFERAEAAARQAMFHAARIQAPDLLYQWYWQLGKLQRSRNRLDAAVESFDRAIVVLGPIREEMLNGYHDSHAVFEAQVRPVYTDYVDALLLRADAVDAGAAQRDLLERARVAVESLKSAELQDYFRDGCVTAREARAMTLEQAGATTAVLYPIVLPDRVELLLSIGGVYHRRSVPVTQTQLQENASRLRELVQDESNERYLPYATRLYRWLIEPVKPQIVAAGVDTLVVIPDGVLRTIPFAALHNGDRFLVEEFALATTPALKLTAPPQPSAPTNVLLAGVDQGVQGFAPLPQVSAELAGIHGSIGGTVLSNRDYTKAKLQAALANEDYGIVHMATHGTVGSTPADSFLVTYDGRLSMGDLDFLLRIGEFRSRPVELLTLSACETAVGDERAALGLAGIAVKSGAKSVVASLWLVNDDSTSDLMNRFYRALDLRAEGRVSKAQALRGAQLGLLGDPATRHPANWAAFLLIGNWQ